MNVTNKSINQVLEVPKVSIPTLETHKLTIDQIAYIIRYQESRDNPDTLNVKEDAVGAYMIRKITVREVNRLYGTNYTYEDRYDPIKAHEMFVLIQKYYNPSNNLEIACRVWNGGPNGMNKQSTLKYWNEVKLRLYEEENQYIC